MPMHTRRARALAAGCLLNAWGMAAQAHAKLLAADPAADTAVGAPQTITLHFSEDVARKLSSIKLVGPDGGATAIMIMDTKDAKTLLAMPNATLMHGTYTVSWTVVATDDGHRTAGSYHFTVK